MESTRWLRNLKFFFENRASVVSTRPVSREELCTVSGRDPRLWKDEELYGDLIESIVAHLELNRRFDLLEVGCAAGFLAQGLAPMVEKYKGVDIANGPLRVARSLGLANATFEWADATKLPFSANSFDRVLCYDVLTNIPEMAVVISMVTEMVRVTRAGGKIMLGNLANKEKEKEVYERAEATRKDLDAIYGPMTSTENESVKMRIFRWLNENLRKVKPEIICYSFLPDEFSAVGSKLDVQVRIAEIHKKNPYYGTRFNVILDKPG